MHEKATSLSQLEREQLFALLLKKLEQDLQVSLKVSLTLENNKIIPTIYAIAEKERK